jgi:hypothetical protein
MPDSSRVEVSSVDWKTGGVPDERPRRALLNLLFQLPADERDDAGGDAANTEEAA